MDTRNSLRLGKVPKRRRDVGSVVFTHQHATHGALRQQGLARHAAHKFLAAGAVVITRIHICVSLFLDADSLFFEIGEPAAHRVLGKRMFHHAGLGIGPLKIDAELLDKNVRMRR